MSKRVVMEDGRVMVPASKHSRYLVEELPKFTSYTSFRQAAGVPPPNHLDPTDHRHDESYHTLSGYKCEIPIDVPGVYDVEPLPIGRPLFGTQSVWIHRAEAR